MQAIWYEQQGTANQVLQFGEREMPIVKDGNVLVRLHSSAVNPSDIKKRSGGQAIEQGGKDGYVIIDIP